MKKRAISIIFASMMAVAVMTGCTKAADADSLTESSQELQGQEETTQGTTSEEEAADVTVTHSKGTTTIAPNPGKAVVFDMGVLDIIDALGVHVELGVPVDSLPGYLSKYEKVENVGGIKEPDMEAIFAFEPDVIFISGRQADYYDELNKIAPAVYIDLAPESYIEDLNKNVSLVAEIFGEMDQAEVRLKAIQEKTESIKELASASEKKALIILTNDGSISSYGLGSRFGIIHDVLGVKAADESIDASTHGQEASFEYISQMNPDILFVVDRAVVVGGSVMASDTLNNELVNDTTAAKEEKIVYLDPDTWYLSGGGLTSVMSMLEEVEDALK